MHHPDGHRERATVALAWLGEVHGLSIGATRMQAYLSILADADVDLVEGAIRNLATEADRFPKPVEILKMVQTLARDRVMSTPQLKAPDPTAQERAEIQKIIDDFKIEMGWDNPTLKGFSKE